MAPSDSDLAVVAKIEPKGGGEKPAYINAIDLFPASIAGLIRIPDLPKFRVAWKQTHLGKLMDEESMQPFVEAQRARATDYLNSLNSRIGIRLEDLYEIGTGEAVIAWLPFENDKRRPFAVCVLTDIRGKHAAAQKVMETIDKDLLSNGWTRTDRTHHGQEVRIYDTKPKRGQLKVEQLAITLSEQQIIAADRDSVVTDLLDAIKGQPKGEAIGTVEEFKLVLTRGTQALRKPVSEGGGTFAAEWFARPLKMGRIVRESMEVDRNQLNVIKLLENQGFDVVSAAGGIFAIAGKKYDLLQSGFVIVPKAKLEKAARMLQLENEAMKPIPTWVHEGAATFSRVNPRIEDAFWASETLINEAFGDEIFRDIIEGIRDDEDGPQIDIAKNVLPNLDDQVILITDNTVPAKLDSERMLVAIRVRDAAAIKLAIRKAMEVEPDANKMDVLPGVEIWRVQRGESEDDFDAELFGDLELGFDEEGEDEPPPLLDHWAIALVDKGPGSNAPYLMFSSHPDLLVLTAKRIQQGTPGGLQSVPDVDAVTTSLKELGCVNPAFDRSFRTKLSLRVKYELLRQGKLKESDSVMASIFRRIFEDQESDEPDPLNATKLPPLNQVEQHLPDGGAFFEATDKGWAITGFLLK